MHTFSTFRYKMGKIAIPMEAVPTKTKTKSEGKNNEYRVNESMRGGVSSPLAHEAKREKAEAIDSGFTSFGVWSILYSISVALSQGAEMFVQLAACSFDCGQGVCQDVCATCSLQFRLRVFADTDGADMFVQLAACSFDCGSLRTMKVPPVLDTTVVGGRRLQQSRCRNNE